jgi:hypothetical protein
MSRKAITRPRTRPPRPRVHPALSASRRRRVGAMRIWCVAADAEPLVAFPRGAARGGLHVKEQ